MHATTQCDAYENEKGGLAGGNAALQITLPLIIWRHRIFSLAR
ncbi:MAG: hypothetical protein K0S95_2047 [Pantoea eucrina]|nr:hypothetical protein [Pantoea eucrina]